MSAAVKTPFFEIEETTCKVLAEAGQAGLPSKRQTQRRQVTIVEKSTFLDVVGDVDAEEQPLVRRKPRRAATEFGRSSDSSQALFVLQGARWLKCDQADPHHIPTVPSTDSLALTSSPSDEPPAMSEVSSEAEEGCFASASGSCFASDGGLQESESIACGQAHCMLLEGTHVPASAMVASAPGFLPMTVMCIGQSHLPAITMRLGAEPSHAMITSPAYAQHMNVASCTAVGGTEESIDHRTTLVLRNLPNNYNRNSLVDLLNAHGFAGKYDFLYYPVDFQTLFGLGYAFVNFITHADASSAKDALEGFRKWAMASAKVCTVSWSNGHQGLVAHIERYRNSSVMHKSVPDSMKPVIFQDGVRVDFPCSRKKLWPPSSAHGLHVNRQSQYRARPTRA